MILLPGVLTCSPELLAVARGLKHLCRIVDRVCAGQGREGDLELLDEISLTVEKASLCALGQTAPNP
ncbi:MAG: hypothetical protein JXB32_18085, partial [Deltaproteobacteria bacterium]|nr:hypothetical protein [Deltaproteobacteria bacterium]